ncbi:MAG: hemerythrin domain-containing protein [Azoarcus sp.]|nr:hemerythrin domain-containing protein [Azoarcus sp.]
MSTISARLGRHHRECDAMFASADNAVANGDWGRAAFAFTAFRKDLEAHFLIEEDLLFARFEAVTGNTSGPTQVMRGEHQAMREALGRIADALSRRDADDFAGECETLFVMMQQHNMKEEHVLYPLCDRHLSGETATLCERIAERIEEARL